jgi:predicted amidohydrolase YtcJ
MDELLLYNGMIHTVDSKLPSAEAVCIQGERISFVGTEREARARASVSAQRVDLQGRTLIPGKPPLTPC